MALAFQGALKGVSPVEQRASGSLFRGFPAEGIVWFQNKSLCHHLDGLSDWGVSNGVGRAWG